MRFVAEISLIHEFCREFIGLVTLTVVCVSFNVNGSTCTGARGLHAAAGRVPAAAGGALALDLELELAFIAIDLVYIYTYTYI